MASGHCLSARCLGVPGILIHLHEKCPKCVIMLCKENEAFMDFMSALSSPGQSHLSGVN